MERILEAVLALAAGSALVLAWMVVATALRVTRLPLRRSRVTIVARTQTPQAQREVLQQLAAPLAQVGFAYRCSTVTERGEVAPPAAALYSDIYEHADGEIHAWVSTAARPEPGEACTVTWVTLRADGTVVATVNRCRHTMMALPAGWTVHDDYFPDLAQAWQRHRARVEPLRGKVVTDALQVFRAVQRAAEELVSDWQHRGLLATHGEQWRVRWLPAVLFAWRLLWGRRRAARARRSRSVAPRPAAAGDVADVAAARQR